MFNASDLIYHSRDLASAAHVHYCNYSDSNNQTRSLSSLEGLKSFDMHFPFIESFSILLQLRLEARYERNVIFEFLVSRLTHELEQSLVFNRARITSFENLLVYCDAFLTEFFSAPQNELTSRKLYEEAFAALFQLAGVNSGKVQELFDKA